MGSITSVIIGLVLLGATFVLVHTVRPREGRASPAWVQSDTAATVVALALVVGCVFGFALIIAGALG